MTAATRSATEGTATGAPPTTFVIEGETVTIPVHVRSARMIGAQYFVDADAAQEVIGYSGLTIARQRANKAVCSLSAVQYLDNDLGPYNEVAVAFVVHPHDAPPHTKVSFTKPTTFIHKLPVNQAFTCAAGKGIWGFPKWVTSITFTTRGKVTEAVLIDDDEFVLSLAVRRSPLPLPSREMEMACYSSCDGLLRRTPWTTRNDLVSARIGGARLELGSRHPMAQELRTLGLPKGAFMSMTTGRMSATFGLADELGWPDDDPDDV